MSSVIAPGQSAATLPPNATGPVASVASPQAPSAVLSPQDELAKINSDPSFAGGQYYGRTPNGIADLVNGGVVGASTGTGTNAAGTPGTWTVDPATGLESLTPIISSSGVSRYGGGSAPAAPTAPDANAIRASALADAQAQVQALQQQYAGLIKGAQDTGTLNLGKQRAIDARSGTLGQDFGNSNDEGVNNTTKSNVEKLTEEMNTQIASVLARAQSRGDTLAGQAQTQFNTESSQYKSALDSNQKSARDDVATLAKGGIPLESLDPTEKATLLAHSGMTEQAFDDYYKANLPENIKSAAAATQSGIDQGIVSLVSQGTTDPTEIFNALTKQGINVSAAQVASALKSLTTKATTGDTLKYTQSQIGKLLAAGVPIDSVQKIQDYYNGHGDSSALDGLSGDQTAALHNIMNGTKATSTGTTKSYTSGGLNYTSGTLGAMQTKINASKGSDGYVDPTVYQEAFNAWTQDGGLAKDFIKNFPPKTLVNPANTWLPQYLESKTTKSSSSSVANDINSLFPASTPTKPYTPTM